MQAHITSYSRFVCIFFLSTFLSTAEYQQNYLSMNARLGKEKEAVWLWVKQAGGIGRTYGSGAAVDNLGNVYIAGFLSGTADFDGQILAHRSEVDILIVKYRPNGSIAWIKQIGDAGFSNAESIATGKDGNLYITGTIRNGIIKPGPGSARIGSFELRSNGGEDMFILCLNPDGKPLWAAQPGSLGEVQGEGIAVDNAGNCYVIGTFKGRFGNTDVVSTGEEDIFISKYNSKGRLLWVRRSGGPAQDEGLDIAVDQDGSCYVTGFWGKETNSDTLNTLPNRVWNFFLTKYDSKGSLLWQRQGVDNNLGNKSIGYGVAVDTEGNSYVTGAFSGELVLGATRLNSVPSIDNPEQLYDDVFVVKYDPAGMPVWAVQGGGSAGDDGKDITVDAAGNVYVTGSFYNSANFGTNKLTGGKNESSNRQVFIAKYDRKGTLKWVEQSTSLGPIWGWPQSSGNGIALNSHGDCYVSGFFDVAIQFGSIKLEGFNSRNMFVAKINSR